jgi:hypothetical protein
LHGRNVVNVFEDKFQYCNGMFLVNLSYGHHDVISKLFKVKAIESYREFNSKETHNFSKLIEVEKEIEAEETKFLKDVGVNYLARVFKIGDKYCLYNKKYLEIFKDVTYRANPDDAIPTLRVYYGKEFVGLLLPIKEHNQVIETGDILKAFEIKEGK